MTGSDLFFKLILPVCVPLGFKSGFPIIVTKGLDKFATGINCTEVGRSLLKSYFIVKNLDLFIRYLICAL